MAESTHLDALTAELLGDVGILYDQVKALKIELPQALQPLNDTKQQLAVVLNKLVTENKVAKEQQAALINDRLVLGLNEIKVMTQGQIELLDQAAQHITADEREAMFENARQAREAAVVGVLETIERTVNQGLSGVSSANVTFTDTSKNFRGEIATCIVAAKKSVSDFDQALKIAASDHEPMGKFGYFMLSMITVVITLGAAAFLGSHGYFSGEAKLSKAQAEQIVRGQQFDRAWEKLDAKTRAKIQSVWGQQ